MREFNQKSEEKDKNSSPNEGDHEINRLSSELQDA